MVFLHKYLPDMWVSFKTFKVVLSLFKDADSKFWFVYDEEMEVVRNLVLSPVQVHVIL